VERPGPRPVGEEGAPVERRRPRPRPVADDGAPGERPGPRPVGEEGAPVERRRPRPGGHEGGTGERRRPRPRLVADDGAPGERPGPRPVGDDGAPRDRRPRPGTAIPAGDTDVPAAAAVPRERPRPARDGGAPPAARPPDGPGEPGNPSPAAPAGDDSSGTGRRPRRRRADDATLDRPAARSVQVGGAAAVVGGAAASASATAGATGSPPELRKRSVVPERQGAEPLGFQPEERRRPAATRPSAAGATLVEARPEVDDHVEADLVDDDPDELVPGTSVPRSRIMWRIYEQRGGFGKKRRVYLPVALPRDLQQDEWQGTWGYRRSTTRRFLIPLLVVLVLLGAGGVYGVRWVDRQITPGGPLGPEVAVEVPEGASTGQICDIMADADVISSATVCRYYIGFKGESGFQPGEYTLNENMALPDVITALQEGVASDEQPIRPPTRMTIPEGWTLEQIAERVGELPGMSSDEFLRLATNGSVRSEFQNPDETQYSLEGLLYPDTYEIGGDWTEIDVLQLLVNTFEDKAEEAGIDALVDEGFDPYRVVIVASLIEREALLDEERPTIASVIWNRVFNPGETGGFLQIDASVIYGLPGHVLPPEGFTQAILDDPNNPYNTYVHQGLPPTPIGAPRMASLQAAAHPAETNFYYYVLTDTEGHHAFAETLDQHIANRNDAQARGVI
jgi:UPF0755 protein